MRLAPPTKPFSLPSVGAVVDSCLADLLARRENFVLSHEETLPVSLSFVDFEVVGPLTVVSVVAAGMVGATLGATGISGFIFTEGSVKTGGCSVSVAGAVAISVPITGATSVFDVALTSSSVSEVVFPNAVLVAGSPSTGAENTRLAISSAFPLKCPPLSAVYTGSSSDSSVEIGARLA